MFVPIDLPRVRRYGSSVDGIGTEVRAHQLRWAIVLTVFVVGCCSEDAKKTAGAPPATASVSASTSTSNIDVPHRRLLGKWRYDEPTNEQLAGIERRTSSISERDRLIRAAHELTGVTQTYTKDRRRIDFGGGKPIVHRYEVLNLDAQSITLRLSPHDGRGKSFEETLRFTDDDKMVEVVDGMPRMLTRM